MYPTVFFFLDMQTPATVYAFHDFTLFFTLLHEYVSNVKSVGFLTQQGHKKR